MKSFLMIFAATISYRAGVSAFLCHHHGRWPLTVKQRLRPRINHGWSRPGFAAASSNKGRWSIVSSLSSSISSNDDFSFPHFVFGYGSLICPDSRAITAPTVADRLVLPASVKGVQRTWAKKSQVSRATSMGVRFHHNAKCVGVLVPVDDEELYAFDKREVGYDRYGIHLRDIEPIPHLLGGKNPDYYYKNTFLQPGFKLTSAEKVPDVWIYVQQDPVPATPQYPIAQTYVDIMLRGCFSISEQFAEEFIETTKGWHPAELLNDDDKDTDMESVVSSSSEDSRTNTSSSPRTSLTLNTMEKGWWVDDRMDPLYVRADPAYSLRHQHKIDQLLKAKLPTIFNKRIRRGRSQVMLQ